MKTHRIILNADDLGISSHVNSEIFRLMESGKLTSATMMANAPAIEEAAQRVKEFPQCSFGVHMNITEFAPLTQNPQLRPILDENGLLKKDQSVRKMELSSDVKNAIFEEYCAQVEKIRSLGVPISHLDSHHHIHTHPPLFPIVKAVQKKFGIRKVRCTQNIYTEKELGGRKLHLVKKAIWNGLLRWNYATKTTGGFTKFSTFVELAPKGAFPYTTLELMLHPGHENPEYRQEILDLETDWETSHSFKVEKISYNDL